MNGFHNYFLTHEGPLVGLLCLEKFQKHGFQPLSMVGFSTFYLFQILADCVELHFYSTFRKADIIFFKLVFFFIFLCIYFWRRMATFIYFHEMTDLGIFFKKYKVFTLKFLFDMIRKNKIFCYVLQNEISIPNSL